MVEVPEIIPGGSRDYMVVVCKPILVISLKPKSRLINIIKELTPPPHYPNHQTFPYQSGIRELNFFYRVLDFIGG